MQGHLEGGKGGGGEERKTKKKKGEGEGAQHIGGRRMRVKGEA